MTYKTQKIPKNTNLAGIIIDMQLGFTQKIDLGIINQLVKNQQEVMRLFVKTNTPIYLIEFRPTEYGETIRPLSDLAKDSKCTQTIWKNSNNAFATSDLKEYLDENKINAVCAMGINANACVLETLHDSELTDKLIITGKSVIANPKYMDFEDYKDWFHENTSFYNTQKKLIKKLKNLIY